MKRAITFFLAYALLMIVVGIASEQAFSHFDQGGSVPMSYRGIVPSAVANIIAIAVILRMRWYDAGRTFIRSHPWGTLLWTILLAVGIVLPLAWVEDFIPDAWREDLTGDLVPQLLSTTTGYFVICMLAPLAEEVVFRGAILSALMRWGTERREQAEQQMGTATRLSKRRVRWMAIVISALLFSIMHLNPAQMPHALLMGMLLAWLTLKTGSIFPAFLIHWINNSFAYAMLRLYPMLPTDASVIDYFNGSRQALLQAVISSLLIALPALYQLSRRKYKG